GVGLDGDAIEPHQDPGHPTVDPVDHLLEVLAEHGPSRLLNARARGVKYGAGSGTGNGEPRYGIGVVIPRAIPGHSSCLPSASSAQQRSGPKSCAGLHGFPWKGFTSASRLHAGTLGKLKSA